MEKEIIRVICRLRDSGKEYHDGGDLVEIIKRLEVLTGKENSLLEQKVLRCLSERDYRGAIRAVEGLYVVSPWVIVMVIALFFIVLFM